MNKIKSTRKHKRYKVDLLEINGRLVLARYVKIIDISIGGISFQTEKRIHVGREYTLKIEGKMKVLTVRGKVVWSVLNESIKDSQDNVIPLYTAGMKFTDVTDKRVEEIAHFIDGHKRDAEKKVDLYATDGQRLHVRVHVEKLDKVFLNDKGNYKVKNLGIGGMLIESSHALAVKSTLPMEILLPEDICIQFLGRVTSCRKVNNTYDIGIAFFDISGRDEEQLNSFIRSLNNMDIS